MAECAALEGRVSNEGNLIGFLSEEEALMFSCMLIMNIMELSAHETLRDNIHISTHECVCP